MKVAAGLAPVVTPDPEQMTFRPVTRTEAMISIRNGLAGSSDPETYMRDQNAAEALRLDARKKEATRKRLPRIHRLRQLVHKLIKDYVLAPGFRASCPQLTLHFSGHSLGGGLAQLASYELNEKILRLSQLDELHPERPVLPKPIPAYPRIDLVTWNALGAVELIANSSLHAFDDLDSNSGRLFVPEWMEAAAARRFKDSDALLARVKAMGRNYRNPLDLVSAPIVAHQAARNITISNPGFFDYVHALDALSPTGSAPLKMLLEVPLHAHSMDLMTRLQHSGRLYSLIKAKDSRCAPKSETNLSTSSRRVKNLELDRFLKDTMNGELNSNGGIEATVGK